MDISLSEDMKQVTLQVVLESLKGILGGFRGVISNLRGLSNLRPLLNNTIKTMIFLPNVLVLNV